MKKIKLSIFLLVVVFSFHFNTSLAQETTTSSGGDAIGTGGSSSYSVGQVLYTTNTGTNGSVAQGVQQPYEISIVTAIEDAKDINVSFSVYPNPTTDFLKINLGNYTFENLIYQLFDANGKLLETNTINKNETNVEMSNNSRGMYLLKIINNNKELKTFRIIKN